MVVNFKGNPKPEAVKTGLTDVVAANLIDNIATTCEALISACEMRGDETLQALADLDANPYFQAVIGLANNAGMRCAADR